MATPVGARVGALMSASGDTAYLFGYGIYRGHEVPEPALGVRFFGIPMDHPNPCIELDSGKLIYGCECWWGPEEQVKDRLARYANIVEVDIEQKRREVHAETEASKAEVRGDES